jgi:hypothetical protein
MDSGDGNNLWEVGDHLHVNCSRLIYFGHFAVVMGVEPTRLLVVFADGHQSDFVGRDSVSRAPPLRVQQRSSLYSRAHPPEQRGDNVWNEAVGAESIPDPVGSATHQNPGGIVAPLLGSVHDVAQSVRIIEPLPETQPGLERIVVQSVSPEGNPMRVVMDSWDTSDDDDGTTEVARTLERLAVTVATGIAADSNNPEDHRWALNEFNWYVRFWLGLESEARYIGEGNVVRRSGSRQSSAAP